MRKKTMRVILYSVLLLSVGFLAGTYFGFRQAPNEFIYWDSQFKASLLAYELKRLKAGKIDATVALKEIELDGQLAHFGRHLDSQYFWIMELVLSMPSADEKAIKHASTYRKNNPHIGPDMSDPRSWKPGIDMNGPFIQQTIEGQKENTQLIQTVVERYANN